MGFAIKVNGTTHSVDVDGDTPLLWVLRDVLGMTGTKFGCGMALCGACTVHIDGAPTRSCITPIESVGTSEIASNPNPTDADIGNAMFGNICRCGTYVRIREAIKQAAQGQGG